MQNVEDIVVPEMPVTVPDEVRYIYVPIASYDDEGIASFDENYFTIENGKVFMKPSFLASIESIQASLNNKLTKITLKDKLRCYGIDEEGNQVVFVISLDVVGDSLVIRDENGNSSVADPTEEDHIANKKFVDEENVKQNNMFANALKGEASGEMVLLTEVSPIEHEVKVKLRSKNLISYPYHDTTKTIDGLTFTDNGDGSITINGTNTNESRNVYYYFRLDEVLSLPQGDYCISLQGNDGSCGIGVSVSNKLSGTTRYVASSSSATTTIAENEYISQIYIAVDVGKTVDNITVYPQFEKGPTATKRTPYVPDDAAVTLTTCGKNLLGPNAGYYAGYTVTRAGVTFTVNDDLSIHVKGSSTSVGNSYYMFMDAKYSIPLPPHAYAVSSQVVGNYEITDTSGRLVQEAYYRKNDGTAIDANIGFYYDKVQTWPGRKSRTVTNDARIASFKNSIYLTPGADMDITIYPQFEINTTATEHEPYKPGETITTTLAEGAVLKNIYPNMSIIPDIEGVVVDVEYIKDSNMVIEKLTQAIIALGGNI